MCLRAVVNGQVKKVQQREELHFSERRLKSPKRVSVVLPEGKKLKRMSGSCVKFPRVPVVDR